MLLKILLMSLLAVSLVCGERIETFYETIEIEEPILLELIHSQAMQRLKEINQYGVAFYTTHREKYTRFAHSLGVFAILRKHGASLEEQIAGLLHDISHTVFSHVGDWIFGKEYQEEDYQSMIYKMFLSHSGIEEILIKYGYTIEQLYPRNKKFKMLEQPLPNLCADRIDYNLQGAYLRHFLTKEEAIELYHDLQFSEERWIGTRVDLLKKLSNFSLFMTQDCWGSAANYALSRWLADAMIRGLAIGTLSWKELHFGFDNHVWNKLSNAQDPFISQHMHMIAHHQDYFKWTDPQDADMLVKFRCRAIDPWVFHQGQAVRLSWIDTEFARELEILRKKASEGWPIQLKQLSHSYFGS
jgi:uncharacterized protein